MIASLYKIARGKSRRKRKKPHRAAVGVVPCGDPPVGSRQSFVTRCASRQRKTGSREGNAAPISDRLLYLTIRAQSIADRRYRLSLPSPPAGKVPSRRKFTGMAQRKNATADEVENPTAEHRSRQSTTLPYAPSRSSSFLIINSLRIT